MTENSQDSIRTKVIENIVSEYTGIFGLSPEDRDIVQRNLSHMTDVELGNEILHIQEFYSTSNHIYQKALINTVHIDEEQEKINQNLTLNF